MISWSLKNLLFRILQIIQTENDCILEFPSLKFTKAEIALCNDDAHKQHEIFWTREVSEEA